jgi:putative ABC transport system substrate-binding protein
MRRRDFFGAFGSAVAAWPFVARAQQPAPPVIGFLGSATPTPRYEIAFRQGLKSAGFIEGQSVAIEYRWAEGQYERLPALAAELVERQVAAIIATGGSAPALAAKAATTQIPIVFISGGDPVKVGLVASLNRPGGNVTGVSVITSAIGAKRFDLLHQLLPAASLIGVLVNQSYIESDLMLREAKEAAAATKTKILAVEASSESGIDAAFARLAQEKVSALLVANDPFFNSRREQIVALAARHAIPAMYYGRDFTIVGGLISYGADFADGYLQAGSYIGRILKGAKPADLPVLQPTKFELVINLKSAKALGLEVPPKLLFTADEVIE